jgi:hypothetical protein
MTHSADLRRFCLYFVDYAVLLLCILLTLSFYYEQVQVFGCLTSSDGRVLTGLAEAVCCYAAACMKDDFHEKMLGRSSNNLLQNFQKPKWMASSDSHVRIRSLSEAEIAAHLKSFLERSGVNKERENYKGMRTSHNWWPRPSCSSSIPNIYGVESDIWINEYLPLHKLQVDFGKFENVKVQGWQKCSNHVWEILLSHRQLVCLFFHPPSLSITSSKNSGKNN